MGTVMVYREACRFLGIDPVWTPEALLPPPPVPTFRIDPALPAETALWALVHAVYDIEADDARMRAAPPGGAAERRAHFDRLRKSYPVRREFQFTDIHTRGLPPALRHAIHGLGFASEHE
jgi:erythronate-4-phosphate dehydrogenase